MNKLKKESIYNSEKFRKWIHQVYHKPYKKLELGAISNDQNQLLIGDTKYLNYIKQFWTIASNPKTGIKPHIYQKSPLNPAQPTVYKCGNIDINKPNFHKHIEQMVDNPDFNAHYTGVKPRQELDLPFTDLEINFAIKQTRNKKSTGALGIPYELLKLIHKCHPKFLLTLYNNLWQEEKIPPDWGLGILVLLFKNKKGSFRDKLINYRPITLLTTLWKFYMKLINNRLMQHLREKNIISQYQAGFQKRKGCLQHVAAITEICKRRKFYKKKTILTFFDIRKAYDSVPQKLLWWKVAKTGIGTKMLNVIRNMYSHQTSYVRTPLGETDPYSISLGVRQGCVLSPTLFNIYINDIFEHTYWRPVMAAPPKKHPKTSRWTDPHHMFLYADDIATLCENEQDHQHMLTALENWANKWQMAFNPS